MSKFFDKDGAEVEVTLADVPKDVKDTIIKEAQGLVYSNIDAKLESIVGTSKASGEKTSDYIARVLKEKNEKIESLEKGSPEVSKLQKDVEKLQELNTKLKSDLETAGKDFDEKLNSEYLRSELNSLSIQVPEHLTDEEDKKAYVEDQRSLLLSKFSSKYYVKKAADGRRVIYSKSTDEPVADDNLKGIPTADIFKRDNAYLFKAPKKADDPTVDPTTGKPTSQAGKFKTYEQITADADKKGLKVGSPEWSEHISKVAEESGVEI